jgi:glucokinase
MEYVIGIDLGGTQLRVALVDTRGSVYTSLNLPASAGCSISYLLTQLTDAIAEVRSRLPADQTVRGVGMGMPGLIDLEAGIVQHSNRYPALNNVALGPLLSNHIQLPVVVWNDADTAALGEWRFGGGQGASTIVYVTVGTGIGGSVLIDGWTLRGRGAFGSEIGHMVLAVDAHGTGIHWQDLASGMALGAAAATAMPEYPDSLLHQIASEEPVTGRDVAHAAAQGDRLAQQLMKQEAVFLGLGFTSLLHLFSPDIILVGGSVVVSTPTVLDEARLVVQHQVVSSFYSDVPIRLACLGEQTGVVGAATLLL